MKRSATTIKSKALGKSMSLISYGEKGYPVIAFATQSQKAAELEEQGMVDALASLIDDGRIQLFAVDSNDEESWLGADATPEDRAARQEDYFTFMTDELAPKVQKLNKSKLRPLAMGCSMGALHAALAVLRRPDLFQGCIALSGVYHSGRFFGGWMNDVLYGNDPRAFLPNMPLDHPYVDVYKTRQLVFCSGQAADEEGLADLRAIHAELDRLGVNNWADEWGADVTPSWEWWNKQAAYFMPLVLDDVAKHVDLTAEEPSKKPAAKKTTKKAPAAKAAAKDEAAEAKTEPATKADATAKATKTSAKPAAAKKTAAKATTAAAAKKTEAKAAEPKAAKATAAKSAKASAAKAAKPAAKEAKAAEAKPAAKKAAAKKPATKKASK